jgi:PIN domain nuclease of toxin-antitoxin system
MSDEPSLSAAARSKIEQASAIVVSAVVIWEIAIKNSVGRLRVDLDRLLGRLDAAGAEHLAVTWRHSRLVADLPRHHQDPFDRMLVAQAIAEPLHLLTHDKTLGKYGAFVTVV